MMAKMMRIVIVVIVAKKVIDDLKFVDDGNSDDDDDKRFDGDYFKDGVGFDDEFMDIHYYRKVLHPLPFHRRRRRDPHNICDLGYKTPNEISVVFHNGFNYDYHFIMKELETWTNHRQIHKLL